jgi:hypothetical protein
LVVTPNLLYAIPFFNQSHVLVDSFSIYVSVAATGLARMAIYHDSGAFSPQNLLLDSGNVGTGTTGRKSVLLTLRLEKCRLYWLAVQFTGAPTIVTIPISSIPSSFFGISLLTDTAPVNHLFIGFPFAPFPATFPTPYTLSTAIPPTFFLRLTER